MSQDTPSRYAEYREKLVKEQRWAGYREWPRWLSLLADVLGIAAVAAIPLLAQAEQTSLAITALVVVAGVAMLSALILHRRNERASRYARAMASLHLAIHILRDEAATVSQWNDKQVKNCLSEVLSSFATAFSIIVGAPCRACIKVIDFIPPEGMTAGQVAHTDRMKYCYARTFCRDSATQRLIGQYPEDRTEAPIRDNTDFHFLEDIRQRYFAANNLPKMMSKGTYGNTSIRKYGGHLGRGWSLPYKAAMVWPIRMVTDTKLEETGRSRHFTGHQDIVGYLAVDTMLVGAFYEEVDSQVGALLADALYLFFTAVYFQHEERATHATQPTASTATAEPATA